MKTKILKHLLVPESIHYWIKQRALDEKTSACRLVEKIINNYKENINAPKK